MRKAFALVVLAACPAAGRSQPPPPAPKGDVPVRFGVQYRASFYPQSTPREALASAIGAVERGRTDYLVAYLLDPAFVDARVADRARDYEPEAEAELLRLRQAQARDPDGVPPDRRVPIEGAAFQATVRDQARAKAALQVVADVRAKLVDDTEALKELRKFHQLGAFADAEATSKVTLPDVKERAVFLKKIGDRWFVENRQVEEKPAAAPAAP